MLRKIGWAEEKFSAQSVYFFHAEPSNTHFCLIYFYSRLYHMETRPLKLNSVLFSTFFVVVPSSFSISNSLSREMLK